MKNAELGDQASALASLADYQPGAIVSRVLLGKAAGTVTLFAFDAGQGLSEHSTPYDALVICAEGALGITIEADAHALAAGDILLLPANRPHAVHARQQAKMLLVMIREA